MTDVAVGATSGGNKSLSKGSRQIRRPFNERPPYLSYCRESYPECYAVNTGVDETAYSRQDNARHADGEACACVRVALDGGQGLRALLHVHGLYDKQVVVE